MYGNTCITLLAFCQPLKPDNMVTPVVLPVCQAVIHIIPKNSTTCKPENNRKRSLLFLKKAKKMAITDKSG
jgi:hypothetical protein